MNHTNNTNNTIHTHYVNNLYIYIILTIIIPCFCSLCYLIYIYYNKKNKSIYSPLMNVIIKKYNETDNNTDTDNDIDIDTNSVHIIYNFDEDVCAICLESLETNLVKFKVCEHILHEECSIEFILNKILHCPICRKYLYEDDVK